MTTASAVSVTWLIIPFVIPRLTNRPMIGSSCAAVERMTMSDLLAGKVVVITGGGSGIGAAGARLAARDGAQVVAALALPAAEAVAAECGGTALAVDVRDSGSVQAMVASVVARHGRIDGLF